MSKILAKDFQWENYDGQTEGYSMDHDWEIMIQARPTAKDIRWGEKDTNVRTWSVYNGDLSTVIYGEADGVRACKKEALDRLNQIVSTEEALKEES